MVPVRLFLVFGKISVKKKSDRARPTFSMKGTEQSLQI